MKLNQAVILAGGKGTRLKPYTDKLPKPLAPVIDVPFLDYLIFSLIREGISSILILVGYKSELIIERYSRIKNQNVKIDFSIGNVSDKTGKRIIDAYDKLDKKFLLVYGDNYWPLNLKVMVRWYQNNQTLLMTTVYSNKDGMGEYGFENNIIVKKNNIVEGYDKERKNKKANGVDIGYFIIDKSIINPNINYNISFERDIITKSVKQGNVSAFVTDKHYYYITNESALKNFETAVKTENFLPLPNVFFEKI